MTKQTPSLRRAAMVTIAAALSLPAMAGARAAPQPDGTPTTTVNQQKHPAKPHWRQSATAHRNLYGAVPARDPAGCTWPYRNQFPPCMATWPAGDPNFHGSTHPGPTFFDEQ